MPFEVRKQLYLSREPAVSGSIMHKGVESKGNICECLIQMLRVQKNLVSKIVFHMIWKCTKE